MTPIFMRIWLMKMTMERDFEIVRSACAAPGSSGGLQAHMAVTHLALKFCARHETRDGVDDKDVQRAGAHQRVVISSACSPLVGLCDQRFSTLQRAWRHSGVERVFGVDDGQNRPPSGRRR